MDFSQACCVGEGGFLLWEVESGADGGFEKPG
jgi:hypothetical protein